MKKNRIAAILLFVAALFPVPLRAQDLRTLVARQLADQKLDLETICPSTDPVSDRVFKDYGAIFVSKNGGPQPPACVFNSEKEVSAFQAKLAATPVLIGGTPVLLRKTAAADLQAAITEAAKAHLAITPRGGSEASTRSYQKTVDLWRSRFEPALSYWTAKGKIRPTEAAAARKAEIHEQVAMVLAWEAKGYWFSKDLSKSILYSVAVPGASQHIFMLALDVEQFADARVRSILAKHGWFQTVKSDLPHFTYLGVREADLPKLGLESAQVGNQTFWIPKVGKE